MDDKEFLEKIRDTFEKDKIKLADKKVDYGQEDFKGHGQPDGGQNDVRDGQMVQKTRTVKRNKH